MQKYNKLNDCNALGIEAFVEALFCYSSDFARITEKATAQSPTFFR
jgi:hypothetical protein